jgi:hypothetical protein
MHCKKRKKNAILYVTIGYMGKFFHFHNSTNNTRVDEPLTSKQCTYVKNTGAQCGNRCQVGLHHCWIHLRLVYNVRIKDTATMGKGLFADNGTTNNEVVFAVHQNIIEYEGEKMNAAETTARYGNKTGPYLVGYDANTFYDCAIDRCAAGLVNHQSHSLANARFSQNNLNDRVRIKARKPIRNGTQIRVSYNSAVGGRQYKMKEAGVKTSTNTRRWHA